ncbi:hypothetical protein BIW11_07804 [Tropilaelaps mercedesae]|uniref:Uncharacterized protein n=1 Tax=Tropilaelaps mercedesae TaxID=418985 RepID=A0A1V9XSQ4_9ACAR|nr:hypothetical protein BIW11_07804 [Tropilaelaps mercedesae]
MLLGTKKCPSRGAKLITAYDWHPRKVPITTAEPSLSSIHSNTRSSTNFHFAIVSSRLFRFKPLALISLELIPKTVNLVSKRFTHSRNARNSAAQEKTNKWTAKGWKQEWSDLLEKFCL